MGPNVSDIDVFDFGGLLRKVGTFALTVASKHRIAVLSKPATSMDVLGQTCQETGFLEINKHDMLNVRRAIDRLCMWPAEPTSGHLNDNLRLLILNDPSTRGGLVRYRQSQAADAIKQSIINCVRDYLDHRKRGRRDQHFFQQLTDMLENLTQMGVEPPKKQTRDPPVDYPTHINDKLHKALCSKTQCRCPVPSNVTDRNRRHQSRLRLKHEIAVRDDHITFDVLFSSRPVLGRDHSKTPWQQVRFYILRSEKKARVRFSKESLPADELAHALLPNWCQKVKSVDQFCEILITNIGQVYRCLKLEDHDLFVLQSPEESDVLATNAPTISLASVLSGDLLTSKMKLILACIIAHSLWRFYDSEWANTRWSVDSIHFVKEEPETGRRNATINAAKPCLIVDFERDEDEQIVEFHQRDGTVMHQYPRVLSLGSILVNIGYGALLPLDEHNSSQSLAERVNSDYIRAKKALKDPKWPYFGLSQAANNAYRLATEACFNDNIFDQPANHKTGSIQPKHNFGSLSRGADERRAILYTQVVYPIEELVRGLKWHEGLQDIESIDPDTATTDSGASPEPQIQGPNETVNIASGDASWRMSMNPSSRAEASNWLHRLAVVQQDFIISSPLKASPQRIQRTKIAVLDTGYDQKSDFFADRDRRRRLKRQFWRDLSGDASEAMDEDGHGSHVLSLIMRAAPLTDIYVVRVAKDSDDLSQSCANIARAIELAATEWAVDVISMSFGFSEGSDTTEMNLISTAIEKASLHRQGKILFFAAAGNEGANRRVVFPASHDKVIPVFGTNAYGEFQRSMNPPLEREGPFQYGTLAVDLPCAGLRGTDQVYQTGTSFATAIVAGMAATILQHARVLEAKRTGGTDKSDQLLRKKAMLSMFRATRGAQETDERRYYLNLLDFYACDDDTRWATIIFALTHQ